MLEFCNHISAYFAFCQPVKSLSPSLTPRHASLFFFFCTEGCRSFVWILLLCGKFGIPPLLTSPATDRSWREGGGEVSERAQEQPARGAEEQTLAPALPDVPSGRQAPPPPIQLPPPPSSQAAAAKSSRQHSTILIHPPGPVAQASDSRTSSSARIFCIVALALPPPIPHPPNLERSHRYIL